MKDFLAWYAAEARPPLGRAIVQQHRSVLESAGLAPPSINLRLSEIRKLAAEAAENGLFDRSVAQGIVSLKGRRSIRRQGRELASHALLGRLDMTFRIPYPPAADVAPTTLRCDLLLELRSKE